MSDGVNGLKELFNQFADMADDPKALWTFYAAQSTAIKIVLWGNFPQYHAALRDEECKDAR